MDSSAFNVAGIPGTGKLILALVGFGVVVGATICGFAFLIWSVLQ
jgi:hypothetical protein